MTRALLVLLAIAGTGCAYYNAMWSAERYAKDARAFERRGRPSEARSQWALAAAKAQRVALRHPKSRWADDALALQAEGLARSGACDEAASIIQRVREVVKDQALLEQVALADAECALTAGRPVQAEAAIALPLASNDDSRRSRAELLAGQAAAARLDYAAAVSHFERSRETRALPGRVRALLGGGRIGEATEAMASLTGVEFETERAELLALFAASETGPPAASAALDRLLARGKRIPFQEQARLLIADADRRLARGDQEAAAAQYRRAQAIASPASNEAATATVGVQRVLVVAVRQPSDLEPIETELARLASGSVAAQRLLDLVRQAAAGVAAETPAASFRAAELARDSLGAPVLAGELFLGIAARDSASLYAPKALVAALSLLPERRDSIVAVLDRRYAMSPYTRALRGEANVAYAAAEDSLARELGVRIAQSTVATARARTALPVPGPRGPHLDDGDPAAAVRRPRPVPVPARDRAPPARPDRP